MIPGPLKRFLFLLLASNASGFGVASASHDLDAPLKSTSQTILDETNNPEFVTMDIGALWAPSCMHRQCLYVDASLPAPGTPSTMAWPYHPMAKRLTWDIFKNPSEAITAYHGKIDRIVLRNFGFEGDHLKRAFGHFHQLLEPDGQVIVLFDGHWPYADELQHAERLAARLGCPSQRSLELFPAKLWRLKERLHTQLPADAKLSLERGLPLYLVEAIGKHSVEGHELEHPHTRGYQCSVAEGLRFKKIALAPAAAEGAL